MVGFVYLVKMVRQVSHCGNAVLEAVSNRSRAKNAVYQNFRGL